MKNMKNTTTIILFLMLAFASLNTKAQGDLQFNRAFTETIYDAVSSPSTSLFDTFTVDSGKVWKITSVSSNWYAFSNYLFSIELDGIELAPQDRFHTSKYGFSVVQTPIWLSEGTHIVKAFHRFTGQSRLMRCVINGIEFNIIQ